MTKKYIFAFIALISQTLCFSAGAEELILAPSKDTFLRNVASNTNEGANPLLSIRRNGRRTALIAFDFALIKTVLNGKPITNAKMRLYIHSNEKNFPRKGGFISAYLLTRDWTEGNGNNAKRLRNEPEMREEIAPKTNRGSGSGATWMCTDDTAINNIRRDCNTSSRWRGGSTATLPTSTVLVTNKTTDYIEFDVTQDLEAFYAQSSINDSNYGWLIKKHSYREPGALWLNSRESTESTPQLIITY
jgi:hypothetical protein